MRQKNQNWDRILELIFENPNKGFTIREISKETKVASASVQRYIESMRKDRLIDEKNKFIDNRYNKFIKTFFLIEKLFKIGLIDHLNKELTPSAIVLFGGGRKGEYDKESDIDLFIETTKKKEVNLVQFGKKIGHEIQLFTEKDIKDLPDNLLNNVINGIKLEGYLKIK